MPRRSPPVLRATCKPRAAVRGFASSFLVTAAVALPLGCGSPDRANIDLRRQNQTLRDELAQVKRERDAHAATIRVKESQATTVPVLPADRVDELFTVHGIQFGRLTGGADLDPARPGDEGLKVYVVPRDGAGQQIKAAGSFVVEAFDLAAGPDNRVGRWEFPLSDAGKNWFGQAMLYSYVLPCRWPASSPPPRNAELTVKVTFTDGLTRRSFTEQKTVKITPPPAPSPTSAPSTTAPSAS